MPIELEREQAELQRLRSSGNPAALHDADRLEKAYHVRQMNGLAQTSTGRPKAVIPTTRIKRRIIHRKAGRD